MIKLPEQFKAIFAERRPLDEKTGEALAKWAAGSVAASAEQHQDPRDLATLEAIAETKIKEGAAALTQWATTLPSAEKKLIGAERFAAWKVRAAA